MKPVRIGVVGVGSWGSNHARILATAPESHLIGFHDIDGTRAAAAAERFGGACYDDLGALLEEAEAVSITVPTTAHLAVAREALRRGVHVLVEKPIASTPAEAEELSGEAARSGCVLAVGHLERFNPAVEALLGLGSDPRFVEIHRLSPFDVRGLDVSVVLDLMIHDIDILLRLVGAPLSGLEATGVPVLSEQIDIANARIRFANDCVANLTASRISLTKTRKIRIFEENRYISLSYTDQAVVVYRRIGELPPPDRLTPESFGKLVERQVPAVEKGEPLRIEIVQFLRAVRGEPNARIVTAEEGTEALRVAHSILETIGPSRGASS